MTYQPLHHKYRPQTFANLVGQDAIAATLTNALRQQRIAPAYLFTGARGTGKTSSARILAKSLNCLQSEVPTETPCGLCEVCRSIANGSALDVIEIDAASNAGVDNIRELIERSQFAPVQCRYKVYVIDECHGLSGSAMNALLKTLEEPSSQVIFILATTDPQKVLPTIISRCQRFDFRRIPLEAMVQHLATIADKEGIEIAHDALTLIGQLSQGGLRDAESLLDQLSLLAGEVTVDRVWDLVGAVPERDLMALLEAIAQDNPETLLDCVRRLMDRGREPMIVLQNLASIYRDLLIAKTAPARSDLVALTPPTWSALCSFAETIATATILAGQQHLRACEPQLKSTTQPRLWLEVTLMGLLPSALNPALERSPAPAPAARRSTAQPQTSAPEAIEPVQETPSRIEPARPLVAPAAPPPEPEAPAANQSSPTATDLSETWQRIIANLHPLSRALLAQHGSLLEFQGQDARIGISTDKLVKIAQQQIQNIEKAFVEVFNQKVRVSLEIAPLSDLSPQRSEPAPTAAPSATDAPRDREAPLKGNRLAAPNLPVEPTPPEDAARQPLTGWQEDETGQALQSLAAFFSGKIVLSDDETEPAQEQIHEAPAPPFSHGKPDEAADDENLPF
ncbi:DNA polymerase III subunit gamma/tau [Leptolyngbya sp. FACHB-36]|uniref:DNA polymerase III subunit gamma/tau n=1 Tax=Leptolyngbya sp. FACHB-36 TaxID=2692808 RepID=UPI0016810CE9|nr:DNA polymerase III subunit gamma/tau [Leptolyngbya sp. FACHB-36]MBD2019416.1 DNA polymerase III subunit gamma/tau [Leptolyngbya sp. FACHB-36]